MGYFDPIIRTARMYNKVYELEQEKREIMIEAGHKAFELIKKNEVQSDTLMRIADTITDMNNAIQMAHGEMTVKRKIEHKENTPKWQIMLTDGFYGLTTFLEQMQARKKYDSLVIRGRDYLSDAGKFALGLKHPGMKPIQEEVIRVTKEINIFMDEIEKRKKEGKGGPEFIISIVSFFISIERFVEKKIEKFKKKKK